MTASKIQNEREVARWIAEGRTYTWMRDEYRRRYNLDVSVSMFSMFRKRRGLDAREARDAALIPWAVEREHRSLYPAQMLRAEARRRAGKPLKRDEPHRLDKWLGGLAERREVVDYDPAVGWRYVPRRPGDVDIVRAPARPTRRGAR